jgi:hypothetical protein
VLQPASTDGFSVDADDLAELADYHELDGLVDEADAGAPAHLAGGLHVDEALAVAELEAVLVDVGVLALPSLRDREDEAEPNSQNGNPTKINPEKVACFSSPNPDRQPSQLSPAIHHNFTTKKPRPTTRFRQNPQQKQGPTAPKNYCKRAPASSRVLASSGG